MKFQVTCNEDVSTTFYVEAPDQERLDEWLEEHGADATSYLTQRQEVHVRDFFTDPRGNRQKVDYDTEKSLFKDGACPKCGTTLSERPTEYTDGSCSRVLESYCPKCNKEEP